MKRLVEGIKKCTSCELSATKKVVGKGSMDPDYLFIGEVPGAMEEKEGKPFCGPSGSILDEWIEYLGIKESTAVINCLKCRTPENRDPTREELDNCKKWLQQQITLLQPKYIFCVGRIAMKEVLGIDDPITTIAGNVYDKDSVKHFVLPHPAYYLRRGGAGWQKPLAMIKEYLESTAKSSVALSQKGDIWEEKPIKMTELAQEYKILDTEVKYAPVHVHTTHSIGDGAGRVSDLVKRAKDVGIESMAITDHGTVSGMYNFQTECEEQGIKPLLGCEFYVCNDYKDKDRKRTHLVLLAKNQEGLHNIFRLNSIAQTKGYHYKPRITLEDVFKHKEGLVVTSACTMGVVSDLIVSGRIPTANRLAQKLKEEFGDDFYLEIQPHNFPEQYMVNGNIQKIASELDIKMVVTQDVHYINKDDYRIHQAVRAIAYGKKIDDDGTGFSSNTHYVFTPNEFLHACNDVGINEDVVLECFKNTLEVADKCNAKLIREEDAIPEYKEKE